MKTVLVNKPIHPDALARLSEHARVMTPYTASYEALLELLPQVHGLVHCAGLYMGAAEMDVAERLAIISRHGAGVDIVDVAAATQRGIPVAFTPYGPTESTAEHALTLLLATARRLPQLDQAVREGNFYIRDRVVGRELEGKALGVVGFGRIGQRLAEMCRDALHMAVYVYDPYLTAEAVAACGATRVADLQELAGRVDVLSIHVPLTEETRHLVGRAVIFSLKPGAILINTSRGPVVEEAALVEALEAGHLSGAGLDVYDPEPPLPDNPLFCMEQVALTPHLSSFTEEGRRRMGLMAVDNLLCALRGEKPPHLANPEVWRDA
jgi:D-3-phosphoglycerate dehydrogenase